VACTQGNQAGLRLAEEVPYRGLRKQRRHRPRPSACAAPRCDLPGTGGCEHCAAGTAAHRLAGSGAAAGGAWFQVKPTLGSAGITGASIVRQGYIAAAGKYEIYPAVQPDAAGNAAVVFTLTNGARFPSAAYATMKAGGSNFGPAVVAAAGAGPYIRAAANPPRWGDYSFAVPDDASDSAWLATEYIPPKSSQTTTGIRNWGTRVIKVPLG